MSFAAEALEPDGLVAEPAGIDPVVAGTAVHDLDADGGTGIGNQVDRGRDRGAFGKEVEAQSGGGHALVGRYLVPAFAAERDVAADLGAVVDDELVVALAAVHAVLAGAADEGVAAVEAVELVRAAAPGEEVAVVRHLRP